jgi:hypothetical protein
LRKTASKATVWLLSLILCAALIFTGCTPQTKVYCDTETLRIERTGTATTIYDLAGDESYTFRTVRVRKDTPAAEAAAEYKTVYDTATIKIDTEKGAIIVTDKTAGITYTIKRAGIFQ